MTYQRQEPSMIDQELLHDSCESYLKTLIAEVSGTLSSDFDSFAPFGELGIDSFYVLKIVKRLEADFGTLSKSLLFEKFNINDLAGYFVTSHKETLTATLAGKVQEFPAIAERPVAVRTQTVTPAATPICILERDARVHPELRDLVRALYERYKSEGCVSRGTRRIAPNLFIGGARRGYFNYGRSGNIILVYGYAGPQEYLSTLLEEMYVHCQARKFQLNILAGDETPEPIAGVPFSATPFGVMQRITNLKQFSLDGGAMRRLRYQVSKFQKSGRCRTEEYRCGSDEETAREIARVIDRWCESRTMVNPLVHDARADILAGTLPSEHRIFLTYLDDVLQNAIVITALSEEQNGYLMDMEFYPPDMPLGGLEFTIAQMIEVLVAEGCGLLSLGGTYGCKLQPSPNADPEVDRLLDELRAQDIFNDEGNLQFKNKFRPETTSIHLCRAVGSGHADNVIDIIMMIADPERLQTSDAENHGLGGARRDLPIVVPAFMPELPDGDDRSRTLAEHGFNPLNVPSAQVDFDLKTDSWAQLEMPAIEVQMRHLHGQLQQPASVDDSLRAVFPFTHFILTPSGQIAEDLFFKAWPKKGIVLQNLLFPSTIFHEIDKGFSPAELPHPEVFQLSSQEPYKGNMAWEALQAKVAQDPAAVACVCIEVGNNAAGGAPVSMQHLRDVKALLAAHSIPLVLDGTRVMENAQFLIDRETEYAGKSMWAVAREILSCADAVIGSLTKDFCVDKGGIIATNDASLFQRLQELLDQESAGLDLIDRKLIALALQNRRQIEARVSRRMEHVRLIGQALREHGIPIAQPIGGHCILIDVRRIPEFGDLPDPVSSFLSWMYVSTGIRAGAHSVGMQKHTRINDLVRLAIPIGLKREEIDSVIERILQAFDRRLNIPELVMESSAPRPFGGVHSNYRLVKVHRAAEVIPAVASQPSSSAAMVPPAIVPGHAEELRVDPGTRPRRTQDVAIVGMAGRYPKAKNSRELWENLARGRDCVEEIPADRYERRLQHGSAGKYRGGFIDDVDRFDSLFFNISPREAEILDPQERLFLEVAWEAIEDAGYYPEILAPEDAPRNVGVFVGAVWAMYQILGVEETHAGNKAAPNSFLWSIANRVSYCLNLSGPSLTIDTACSSSLTALYLAVEAIQAGDCSAAIAGGVNLDLHQAKLDINSNGNALSADGVCRSFGKGANGYVAGEGIGALFLKPLDRAEQDGDHIYGVIKSAVVNHGGRTAGYTVPNPKAQSNLIAAAIEKAKIGARSIGYIEAHGTGTALGDPIEITGLTTAFSAGQVENQACAIGSIKSNIGHLEAAAGVVGVAKILLQMQHRQLVPSLHSAQPNEFIDFEHSPFYVVQKLEEWKPKEVDGVRHPLRAGISSFGAGGANAHLILESYEPGRKVEDDRPQEEPARPAELIFPLSAKSEDQLRAAALRLVTFLRENPIDLNDAAYTLQQGRKSFEHRLAVIARSQDEWIASLTGFLEGRKSEDLAAGHVKGSEGVTRLLNRREKQELVQLLSQSRDSRKIAGLWAEGLLADWQGFQSFSSGKRISLPTYPFADRRHWIGDPSAVRRVALQPASGVHPMIDSNESTFERQLFRKTFHDRDFFIYDHHVSGIPTLPGVAYLEFARKAGELAAGRPVRRIQNILWVSPISVESSTPKEVFIELKPSGEAVQFEVFSETVQGGRTFHSQGKLLYTARHEAGVEPEFIDLDAIRSRCGKASDGRSAYPLFQSVGLKLGPSFQVLQEIYKNETEVLAALKLPELRQGDLQDLVLHPSLVDGSLQAGMAAQLGEHSGEMLVPYSIGEVEIVHPLQPVCFSYTTAAKGREGSRVLKSNVLIVDEAGKVLARIRESTGVPLVDVHKNAATENDADGFSRLYYSYEWEKAALAADGVQQGGPQSMLLFAADETLVDLQRERLREAGAHSARVIMVRPGESFQELDADSYQIDPRNREDFTRLFEVLAERRAPLENICFAWTADRADFHDQELLARSMERGITSFLYVCQALIGRKLESKVQLLYVHLGRAGEGQPHNEAVTGFVNTLRLEQPKLLCKTLEVRGGWGEIPEAVDAEFLARTQDANAVRYEARERSVRTLKAIDLDVAIGSGSPGLLLREKGVYLITGGAGGLGLIFAGHLAREYKATLVLTGRSPLSAEREARLEELRQSGAEVVYLAADVSRRDEVRNVVDETKARFGAINGIIHSAGVLRDSYVRNKTAEEMAAVFAPKVHGTLHLDEATKDEALDFFVTFSSLAAVAGNIGQSDYSFANHFMDSFVADRERLRAEGARSGQALSLNWSLWADGGMRPDQQTELYLRKALGMKPLSTATGVDAFVRGLATGRSQFAVIEGVREKWESASSGKKKEPPPAAPVSPVSAGTPVAIGGEKEGDLVVRVQNDLTRIVMELLKLEAGDVSSDKILLDLGFDSIGLTTFANAVNDKYQTDITPVLFFDYPSVGEIAKHLCAEQASEIGRFYRGAASPAAAATPPPVIVAAPAASPQTAVFEIRKRWDPSAFDRKAESSPSGGGWSPELRFVKNPIAIVGMSGVMPQSDDLDEFWENLRDSKDLVTVIPRDRWRWEDFDGDPIKDKNKTNSKWGGFMREVDKFDPLFFGISPREAQMMDPQQRIFLEHVWKAIEDSGQKVSDLSGTRTGLFLGVGTTDYSMLVGENGIALDGYTASGNSHSVTANRVSFLLNLRGPSAPIDTACSSSLIAFHRALESIHSGSCEMAIVGGVQVMLSPAAFISFGAAGMLSPDGKCKTFDKRANGYVRGEGCGAVFLKSLAAAEADGNHIYAVIKATAENHGGKVTTMTAPNTAAQADLLIEAYEKAHVDPATIGYIECHGTGTGLGDPIEIQALSKAFSELYRRNDKAPATTPHCALSSVKTNIGHLETGAGIAGVLKVLLAMKHKQIPANLHLEEVNPYINLKGTPFYIADKLTQWNAPIGEDGPPLPRRAGVSSFGFGGANAHVVLEEYLPPARPAPAGAREPQLIVLSAKNKNRLEAYMQSLHVYLEKHEVELVDLAYTLQVGRDEMPERLALVASDVRDLKQKLAAIFERGETPGDSYRNRVKKPPAADAEAETVVQDLIERKELSGLAELWASGVKIDWRLLYGSALPSRISAPTYPFARERCWIDTVAKEEVQQGSIATARLHPLIHRNVSTLKEQKFASRFTGTEFYLSDHRMATDAVLPGVAYVEMAAAAGELAGERKVRFIRDMSWLAPIVVGNDGTDVEVSLSPGTNEVEFAVRTAVDGNSVLHCRGKLAWLGAVSEPAALDVAAIRERCSDETIAGTDLYPFLCSSGLNLGKGFQVVQRVHAGRSESLAVLQLPDHLQGEAERYWLHPALLDGAVHTAIGLVKRRKPDIPWSVPSSVHEIQIFGSLRDAHYAHAEWDLESVRDEKSLIRIQLHLLDRNGKVLVRMVDFAAKPFVPPATQTRSSDALSAPKASLGETPTAALQSLLPVWNSVRPETGKGTVPPDAGRILLLGGDPAQLDWLRASYPGAQRVELVPAAGMELISQALRNCAFDQLLWIAPDASSGSESGDGRIIDEQERGVLTVFRIVKALLQLGYASRKLQWTIVTSRTQRVTADDPVRPAHAAVIGLAGSLAKEHPQWDLRLLDLDSLASVSAVECLSLPWNKQGNALAHRTGEWFQQGLAELGQSLPHVASLYRENGVYVVIGGAGGVGEVWTRFMIEQYQANVVWIGRRECDASIDRKIHSLSRLGPAPLYISADATDAAALEQARTQILKTFPAIHGVVHSAIVLQDQSILRMEEPVFRASLSAKVDVSVNMDRVFGREELDFMLFFSSIVSFVKSPGQSNYAAGCTFKDSFAHQLQQRRSYPVKIMNWGYWGNVGVVADESHNRIMAQMGIGSIEAGEGMASLQALVSSEVGQVVLIKTLGGQAAGLDAADAVTYYTATAPAILPQVARVLDERAPAMPVAALEAELPGPELTEFVTEALASTLLSLGLFRNGIAALADLSMDKRPAPYYERWLRGSIGYLQQQKMLAADLTLIREVRPLAGLWAEWEAKRAVWAGGPNQQAQCALLEACLRGLPAVLTAQQLATDVMFPNSSMHLVEGVYRGNALVDHFNDVLGHTLSACIERQLQADTQSEIRILEIGAGTGGTTAKLLPMLQRLPIAEYCYTDISRAFLMYAEKNFKPEFPALTTAIFDVTRPLAGQAVRAGHYDYAVAANVLHATPDIRETLRNAKAALKNQGVLLLNEIATWSLFNHLTFGLLEGWWLHEDTPVRLSGSPGLAPEKWREILAEEGFEPVLFPAAPTHRFGQQIVAAASNGWTRQRIVKQALPARSTLDVAATSPVRTAAPAPTAAPDKQRGLDHVRRVILAQLSESLRFDAALIRNEAPFAEYGVDSIIGVSFVRSVSEALQIELETTSLFEYSTVDDLAQYIENKWRDQIAAQLGPVESGARIAGPSANQAPEAAPKAAARFMTEERFADVPQELDREPERESRGAGFEPIAIIGMSGRFAESESLDAFWQNLAEGKDLVKTVSRWSAADCVTPQAAGQAYCSHASSIGSFDRFDPAFFGIAAEEATYMDPQQRLFLEESWRALEDAGYGGKGVQEKQCGVYVGCGTSNYTDLFTEDPPAQAWWGNSQSVVPARIAYHLNLQGPAIAIDTACSSAMVAIHLACQGLWSRETEMAVAGGVWIQATPSFHHVANRAGMLSPDGKTYSFDARANGFAPGEAAGVVVLKRLRDALQDGDHVHGVIAGSGINQDGKSNGLIAPNGRAQERLERSVYERFKINPETIQVVEAHATGTLLGDSIEHSAITRSFREYTDRKQFCAIGSVKTNIGHAGNAAGIAGVLKLLLSLKHRQIPPSLHFQSANPAIEFESGPFYVNTKLDEWQVNGDGRRRGAVSSFGFSGTNAHLVIEEAPPLERLAVSSPAHLIVLSARTTEQLKQQAHNLLAFVESTPDLSLNDMSFSLAVGRMHLSHRLSCVARNQAELIHLLGQWIGTGAAAQVFTAEIRGGRVREQAALKKFGNYCIQECQKTTDATGYLENLAAIAELYVQGYSLDLPALFPRGSRRMPLPTYPFAGERYWAVGERAAVAPRAGLAVEASAAPPQPQVEAVWLFSREPQNGSNGTNGSMGAAEKIELFLRQETALHLQKPIEDIPTNLSYFDLGLPSLAMVHLIKNMNSLLDEELSPGALFEYTDIQSLAAYLAQTYPARIDALTVVRRAAGPSDFAAPPDVHPAKLMISAKAATPARQQVPATPTAAEVDRELMLAQVLWQGTSPDDGYEKVTF
jgi:polyketide synthase PksN